MRNIFLAAYSVQINKKRKKDDLVELDNFSPNCDLFKFVSDYLENLKKRIQVESIHRTLLLATQNIEPEERLISGIINVGEYGFEGEGYNVKTGKKSYKRNEEDSEEIPFYYCYYIPNKSDRGILIAERFGNTGIRKAITNPLVKNFNEKFTDLHLAINPLSISDVLAEYLKSNKCTEITLIKSTIPYDYAEKVQWYRAVQNGKKEKSNDIKGTVELSIKTNRSWRMTGLKTKIDSIRDKKSGITSLIQLPNFDYDEAAVTLEANGRKKKFYLSKDDHMRTFLDVTSDCKVIGGHPTYESIHTAAYGLIQELITTI